MISRETREHVVGSVSTGDVRDIIVTGLKEYAASTLIAKIEPFSDGVYVTFANGERFEIDVNQHGQNTQRHRLEFALETIKKAIASAELPS